MHRQIAGKLTGRVTKWFVLIGWIVLMAAFGPLAGKLSGVQDNQASSWLPASAESTKALTKSAAFQDQNAIPTVVVFEKTSGLTPADLAAITAKMPAVQQLPGVSRPVLGPVGPLATQLVSQDHQVAELVVTYNFGKNGWNSLPDAVDKLRATVAIDGLTVHMAGPGGQAADSAEAFKGLDSTLLIYTIGAVVIILLIVYRSLSLVLLPIISAGVALTVAQGVIYLLAAHAGLTVNGQSQGILTVLVFGAGTDYALLLIARYREELRRHEDRHEAMAYALHRAAPAIIASGATVILGMLCLLVAEMNSTKGLGPVAAIGVAVGLLVMLTLLPALLVIVGRWVFWPFRPTFGSPEPTATGLWARVGRRIAVRPRTVWAVTALLLAAASLGIFKLNAVGLSTADSYTKEFDAVVGQKVLLEHGLSDQGNPLAVITNASTVQQVSDAVSKATGLTAMPPVVKGDSAYLQFPLTVDPYSPAAATAVDQARQAAHAVPGADALVGGGPAINKDVADAAHHDEELIIPIVLVVVLLILMLLLRALLAPVILIGTVVLSFGAAMGLSALVFRYVLGFAGADTSLPLFVFVFLVALGIDYNIFLMTRVREETAHRGTREGSLTALAATGGVITSAGLVLAATFLVLGTMPLVAFAEIGLAVALGVILDTMVVRSVLVTALNLDLGAKIWWPSSLDRAPGTVDEKSNDEWEPASV